MMDVLHTLLNESLFRSAMSTALLAGIIVLLRIALYHLIFTRSDFPVETRRRWTVNLRNGLLVLFAIGLVFIWAPQLQTFAVSLFAIAVALVIATKEWIDCMIGSGFRMLTKAYPDRRPDRNCRHPRARRRLFASQYDRAGDRTGADLSPIHRPGLGHSQQLFS